MMVLFSSRSRFSGFTVLGILIMIGILSAMGAGMAVMIATNQQTRIDQFRSDQAFYSMQAGLEFGLAQVLTEGSSAASFSRHFSGETLSITRVSNQIQVTSAKGDATASYAITDPNPPTLATCLEVDQTGKAAGGTDVTGLILRRAASCTDPITIVSMTVSWQPDNAERLRQILIDGATVYNNGAGQASGSLFDITDVTLNDSSDHPMNRLRWNTTITNHDFILTFNMSDSSQKTVNVDFLADDQAACLVVDAANAVLSQVSGVWRDLTGLTIQNTCSSAVRLDKMTVSWTALSSTRNLEQVRINSTTIYNASAASGTEIDVDHVISASTTHTVDRLRFDAEMLARNYTIIWQMSDGTTTTTTIPLFADNENTCLSMDTSAAAIGGTGNRRILGITLENTCSADIGLVALTVSWSGDTGKRFQQVRIDGSTNFNGSLASGSQADFGNADAYLVDGAGAVDLDYLQFSTAVVLGTTYTLDWLMADGTTASTSVAIAAEANSLTVDTSAAVIAGSGDVDLEGIVITNSGSTNIVWSRVIVTWTGAGGRRMQVIRVNGSDVWTGNVTSGSNQNITDVTLAASTSQTINYIRFNGDMSGRSFTLEFIMQDGSTKTVSSFTPPDG